jgi:hypothetical protein
MVDRGHVFRRAFSWLPSQFASQSDAPVGAPRQFGSTEHLSTEAIAAFVDGELRMNAHLRAAHHLSLCPECAAEVEDQGRARAALRDSSPIRIPGTLLGLLSQIPDAPSDDATGACPDDDAGRGAARGGGTPPEGGTPTRSRGRVGRSGVSDQSADVDARDRRKRR